MRRIVVRQRLIQAAALSASAALLAACGAKAGWQQQGGPSPAPTLTYAVGTPLVADGSDTVVVGGVAVKFPTTVTDAAWAPDGSRIAFVNADGNIATARPDGSGLVVLTTAAKVTRARPTWAGPAIVYQEIGADGTKLLMRIYPGGGRAETYAAGGDGPEAGNSAPSATPTVGAGVEFAMVHQGSQGPEVWVTDQNQRSPVATKLTAGTEPALAPDGTQLAYVDSKGHVNVLATKTEGAKPVQVTFDDAKPTHLVWTPDGARIAYSSPAGVQSIAASVAPGSTANPPQQIAAKPGTVTFLGAHRDTVVRLTGADAIARAISASQARWPTVESTGEFNNSAFGAALATTADGGNALALPPENRGPLLFTTGATLDQRTGTELRRVFGKSSGDFPAPVTIVGAVPAQAERTVADLGYTPRHLSGLPAEHGYGELIVVISETDPAVLAAARRFAGTLVIAVQGGALSAAERTYLNGIADGAQVYAVGAGAQQALKASWSGKPARLKPIAISADSPAATIARLYTAIAADATSAVVADRNSPADVAIATNLARVFDGIVLLVDGAAPLDPALRGWLDAAAPQIGTLYIVDYGGGVTAAAEQAVAAVAGSPVGYDTQTNPKAQPGGRGG